MPGDLFTKLRTRAARVALKTSVAFGTALCAVGPLAIQAHAANTPAIQTAAGKVQGFVNNGVDEFLGIPYAAPPVGNLRWRPPVAHAPWKGALKATAYGPICAQITEIGAFAGPPNNNEDCLYLNIFTANIGKGPREKLPVMFWSYGGGEADGESNDYDGSKLALQGQTVVVTFNYRLNLFGFLAHPALDHEGHLFGNYGILDNQFALRWVHDNIAAFGGDPDNVTVLGQSAGSRNAASEVLSPLSKGLFEHAIYESGVMPSVTPLSIAETKGTNFAVAAGCGSGTGPDVAACLRALPAAKVEALAGNGIPYTTQGITQDSGSSAYVAGVIADGTILPLAPIVAYQTGKFNHVSILDGDMQQEGNFFLASDEFFESPRTLLTEAQFVASVTSTYSGNAGPGGSPPAYPPGTVAAVLAHYPASAYPTAQQQWGQEYTDASYTCTTQYVDRILASQVPLYTYEFRDQTAPFYFPPMPGFVSQAYHTGDIQFYWPLYHGGPLGTPHPLGGQQAQLSDQLVAAWTNFARTGNPNGQGDKPWPRYTPSNKNFFTENIRSAGGLSTETDDFWAKEHQCDFWDSVLVYQSTIQ